MKQEIKASRLHAIFEWKTEHHLSKSFNDLNGGLGRASEATSSHLQKHNQALSYFNQQQPQNAHAHEYNTAISHIGQ